MLLFVIIMFIVLPTIHSIYQSRIAFSPTAHEFQPRNSIQLILVTTVRSRIICSAACNEQPACRTFDYDSASSRCRLFEADGTTGSIISSASPTSVVGSVLISPSQFLRTHNQSCEVCQEDRYEYCSTNGSTCQCRPHAFWNGSVCLLQLYENDTCSQTDACRSDLNLTCATVSGQFSVCTSGICIFFLKVFFQMEISPTDTVQLDIKRVTLVSLREMEVQLGDNLTHRLTTKPHPPIHSV